MKSYTDLDQSHKLAEFLPLESADMRYHTISHHNPYPCDEIVYTVDFSKPVDIDIPCWSLAALLAVLPKGINISTPKPVNELGYCCWNQYDEIYASNPVDACVEMIIKLHEQKLL